MNNSHFVPSTLHVIASEIDVSQDLTSQQTKSLGELLEEKESPQKDEENTECGREGISEHS